MTEQMNLRLDKELIEDFEDLAKEENLDRASLVKKILVEGLKKERIDYAIQRYAVREISIERAARLAKVPLYEFIHILQKFGISTGLNANEYQKLL